MLSFEVAKRFADAKAAGRAFFLVCFDSFHRTRGDLDLGYYYVAVDSEQEVRDKLEGKQLGDGDIHNLADVCEAVIDLRAEDFDRSLCQDSRGWLEGSLTVAAP